MFSEQSTMTAPTSSTTLKRFGLQPLARLLPHLLTRIVAGSVGLHSVIIPTLVPLFALRHAQAQTVPAASAPSGQKAIMDAARNGVPIANIAPPSAAGVSRNQFTQFNVNTNGLILNNSAGNVQTQLGGWINGNMQLGLVPARVIINEVVGPNASVLRGAMEVAGRGANIITANPNGLTCDGCSFINTAGRVSLTTGVPQYGANGAVTGFNVPQGVLSIGPGGLSAADLDQLDLIARGIIVAGTVTANRLNVLAGANQVAYDSLVTTAIAGAGAPPSFAVDIKDAGGMYAGQIWLIATEKGLGVNSTGRMSAQQGDLVLSANGDLTYKDGYAKNALSLTAAGNATITGQVQADGAAGGTLAVTAGGQLANTGQLYSATSLNLNAAQIIDTGGTIQAQGSVNLSGQSLQLQGTAIGSNGSVNLGASAGDLNATGATIAAAGALQINAAGQISNAAGHWQSGGDTTMQANSFANAGGTVLAQGQLQVTTTGELNNSQGRLLGSAGVALQGASVRNDGAAQIVSDQLVRILATPGAGASTGTAINNQGGIISGQTGVDINAAGQRLNNTGGTLVAGTSVSVNAAALDNTSGTVSGNGVRLTLGTAATPGPLTNTGGQIIGTTILALQAGAIDNTRGQIATGGALSLNTLGGTLNNASGMIQAGGPLSVDTRGQALSNAGDINNAGGSIKSGGTLTLTTAGLNNSAGLITAAGTLDATTAGSLGNAGGTIAAVGAVTLTLTNASNSAALTNTGGTIASTTGALIVATQGATLANDGGRLQALGDVRIDAGDTSNTGGSITGQNINLTTGALNNSAGAIAAAAGLTLSTQALNNDAGLITAAGDIAIDTHGQTLTNTRSATPVPAANGTAGGIAAGGTLTMASGALNNTTGTLDSSDINLTAASLNNTQGAIRVAHTASLTAADAVTNASGTIDATDITVTAAALDNTSGAIRAARNASVTSSTLNNSAGLLSAKGTLSVTAPNLSNSGGTLTGDAGLTLATGNAGLTTTLAGTLASATGVTLTIAGDYNNAGTLSTKGSLTLNARDVSNSGTLHSDASLTANVRDLGNTGEISGQTTSVNASGTVTNSSAGLIDGTTTTVNAAAVHNMGRIYGDMLTLNAAEISNDGPGVIAARDTLLIATQNLSNSNGALFYAINDIHLGGTYDAATKTVSGSAASLTNTFATVEAGRDLALSALAINNLNAGITTTVVEVSRQAVKEYQSDAGGAFHTDYDWFVSGGVAPCNPTGTNPTSYALNNWNQYQCGTTSFTAYQKANPAAWGTRAYVDPVDINTVTAADYSRWGVAAPGPQATSVEINAAVIAVVNAITAYNLPIESDYGLYGCCHYYEYNYTQVTRETQLASSQPGKILSGRDMSLTGTTVNNVSQIVAGAALTIAGPGVLNQGAPGTREVDTENGQVQLVTVSGPKGWQAFSRAPVVSTIDLHAYTYLDHTNQTAGYSAARSTTVGATAAAANANNHPVAAGPIAGAQVALPVIIITPVSGTGRAGQVVLTTLPGLTVPSSALFTQHADAGAKYLVETDPRFTNQRAFLSSDYYLAQLNLDPERTLKRYGDGFFEQKEINDQILALTGRRYLSDYSSTEAEYQALMDSGVAFAKAFQIAPGVSLSAEQMALLTTDVVLLTQQTVTLADGSTQQVLVPQVYLRKLQDGDLTQSAGLISGRNVTITTTGDLVNAGQIKADAASLSAGNDIVNTGTVQANVVLASAKRDLSNLGGVITGTGNNSQVNLLAGRDILLRTTTNSATVSGPNGAVNSITNIDRVATLSGGDIQMNAGRDLVLAGASVSASGALTLNAVRDVAIAGVATSQSKQTIMDAKTHSNSSNTQDVGSAVSAGADINIMAGQDIAVKGSALQSTSGAINANAVRDITITEGRQTETMDFARETKSSGLFSSRTTTVRNSSSQDSAIGSSISGTSVSLQSGRDTQVRGSNVLADKDVTITAQGKVDIVAAQDTQKTSDYKNEKTSGLFSSGGLSLTLGKREQSGDTQTTGTSATGSTVGAIGGNVNIKAGTTYTQTGSDVQAPAGDVNILAKDVRIDEARETIANQTEQKFKQSGLTVAVTSPVLSALQTVNQMAKAASQTSDGRMQALAGASAALAVNNATNAVKAGQGVDYGDKTNQILQYDNNGKLTGSRDATAADKVGGINVAISLGSSSSQSNSNSQSDTARGSSVTAGGKVSIHATGAGNDSNVVIQGSAIKAGDTVTLDADNKVQLLAARNNSSQTSSNASSSGSIGVSLGASGVGVTASASQGHGNADGQDQTWSNTHVQGNTVVIQSGGDTDVKGAVVTGNTVKANVGGNLNIESLQDTSTYKEASKSIGGSVTVGMGASGSFDYSKTNINSNYASVAEQSSLRAGDGGFQVDVKGNTDLKGGAITSNEQAVRDGKNVFTTGTLTQSDVRNSASYDANSMSLGVGVSSNSQHNPVGSDAQGNAQTGALQTPGSTLASLNGLSATPPVSLQASGQSSSLTKSGISAGAITVTNNSGQQALTGQTAAQAATGIDTSVRNDSSTTNSLKPIFNEKAIKAGFDIVRTLSLQAGTFYAGMAAEADTKLAQRNAAVASGDAAAVQRLDGELVALQAWGPSGDYRRVSTAIIGAFSGNVTGNASQIVQSATVNYLQSMGTQAAGRLADSLGSGASGEVARAALQGIVACAGASAQGGNCAAAASGASAGVVLNALMGDTDGLTASQKEARRNIVTTLVAAVGSGGSNVSAAVNAAAIETENNALSLRGSSRLVDTLRSCAGTGKTCDVGALKADMQQDAVKQGARIDAACAIGGSVTQCMGLAATANATAMNLLTAALIYADTPEKKALVADLVNQQVGDMDRLYAALSRQNEAASVRDLLGAAIAQTIQAAAMGGINIRSGQGSAKNQAGGVATGSKAAVGATIEPGANTGTAITNDVVSETRVGNGTKGQGSGNKIDQLSNQRVVGADGNPIPVYPAKPNGPYATQEFPPNPVAHGFPDIVDNYASSATKYPLNNGASLYQAPGTYNGVVGRFEWIVDSNLGGVTHRMFVPNGSINGIPVKP
jgi:filamentous hemagglutinin